MVRNGNGMLFEADGTVYSGPFLLGLKDGFGVEKAPDGSVYEGPFFSGRRHGVGLVTSMVPITVDPATIWDGQPDANWIGTWTDKVPEMEGIAMKVWPLCGCRSSATCSLSSNA